MRDSKYPLAQAEAVAGELVEALAPYFERLEVAGSIRRRRPVVHDIDLVGIPSATTWWDLDNAIVRLADAVVRRGAKLATFVFKGIQADLYYSSEETWATLMLIRTGSKENNIRLCTLAQKKGWHLKANGDGLFDQARRRIAGDTEESIYEALGLRYQEPWERG